MGFRVLVTGLLLQADMVSLCELEKDSPHSFEWTQSWAKTTAVSGTGAAGILATVPFARWLRAEKNNGITLCARAADEMVRNETSIQIGMQEVKSIK